MLWSKDLTYHLVYNFLWWSGVRHRILWFPTASACSSSGPYTLSGCIPDDCSDDDDWRSDGGHTCELAATTNDGLTNL